MFISGMAATVVDTWHHLLYSVVVITPDSESGDPGSNPGTANVRLIRPHFVPLFQMNESLQVPTIYLQRLKRSLDQKVTTVRQQSTDNSLLVLSGFPCNTDNLVLLEKWGKMLD